MNCGAMLIRETTTPGHVTLFDLVVDPREGDRELVAREADVGEVRVDAREVLGVEMDVQMPLLCLVVHSCSYDTAHVSDECRHAPRREVEAAAGSPVELERPATPRTATTRRTSRCDSRRSGGGRRASSRQELADAVVEELRDVERAEVAGPGFVNLWVATRVVRATRLPRSSRPEATTAPAGAAPRERIQVEVVSANPTGPITVGVGAERRVRRLGRAAARVRRPRRRARVLLQRLGRADGPLPRVGRGAPARGGAARGRLPGRLHRRARGARRRSGADDARADRGRRSSASASTSTRGRARASSRAGCRRSCRGSTPTRRTARSGRARPRTATTRTACSSARPSGRAPTYRAADVAYLATSSSAASTARSTCSAPTTTARATGTRRSRACSATTPSASRCCSTSSSTSTRGGEADEDVEAARRRRLPRRVHGRDRRRRRALVPRLARATTRRSRSTSTSRAEKSEKNPVYYVQYAHARIAGILRNVEASRGSAPTRRPSSRARSATRQAARGVSRASSRRRRSAARRTRSRTTRSASPTTSTASTTSTACSRRETAGVPARPRPGDAERDRALPRPDRGRGARADVAPVRWSSPSRRSPRRGA